MKKNIFRLVKYAFLVFLVIISYKIFAPRNYNVPQSALRAGTKYWSLPTGSRIGYTFIPSTGSKKQYPIIYLHGGPGGFVTDLDIKVLTPLSENGYDLYFYDQVGSGQSDRLGNITEYTVGRHIKDLKEIINKIGADKVILIGQSWGAVLAVLFAAEDPGKVDKLVLTSPGPLYPVNKELATMKAPDSLHLKEPYYSNRQGNEKANNIRTKTISFLATQFNIKLASDKEADNFATYLNAELNKATVCDTATFVKTEAGGGFYSGIMTFKSLGQIQDQRMNLKKLNIPVLVLKGQCDNQKWGFTNEYLELFSNHQFSFIPGAGHAISIEQPGIYINTIKQYLSK